MNAHDLIQEIIERKGKVEHVFWIACGGSMIDLMPANELLKREATTFASTVYTAREFCLMAPKSLGEKSLVIACSHSGNTQEVVDGCEMALAAGAEVVAMTDCESSKIDNGKWTTWVYPWGEGVPQAEVPQGIGVLMAAELLDQQEGYEALADMYEGLKQMDALLPAAREKVNAELGDRFAELCRTRGERDRELRAVVGRGAGVEQKPCVGSLARLDTLDNLGPFALQLSGILDCGRLGSTGGGNLDGIVGLGLRCRNGGRRGGRSRNGLRCRRYRFGRRRRSRGLGRRLGSRSGSTTVPRHTALARGRSSRGSGCRRSSSTDARN